MRTLVIPDVHNAVERTEALIEAHGRDCDRIVFLGDYFDSPGDNANAARQTVNWLLKSTQDARRTHLVGNHDVHYLVPPDSRTFPDVPGSGWQVGKYAVIHPLLAALPGNALHAAVEIDGWLLSHAGFHAVWGQPGWVATDYVGAAEAALTRALDGKAKEDILLPGKARSGPNQVGGFTWLDWDYEFEPIPGVHQIMGHTPDIEDSVRVAWRTRHGRPHRKVFMHASGGVKIVKNRRFENHLVIS